MQLRANRTAVILATSTVLGASVLAGCSSGSDAAPSQSATASTSASASPSPSTTAAGTAVDFDTTLSSVYSSTDVVGADKNQTYGVNILSGVTTINDRSVRVKMLGTVEYTDKSGPIGGFVQLTWSDGTTIGLRQEGTATYDEATKKTAFDAKLTVINGSGKAAGTTGTGTWTGSRSGTVGSSVKMKATLNLVNAPDAMTGAETGTGSSATPSQSYAATIAP